jgi:hypothetical protein
MKRQHLSIPNAALIVGLMAVGGLTVSIGAVDAATIAWTQTVIDTTDGDSSPGAGLGDAAVSTVGTLIEAANFGSLNNVTVNGVLFKGINFSTPPTNLAIAYDSADNTATGFIGSSTGGSIDVLTSSFSRDSGVGMQSAMLTGLTVGTQYQVQFVASFATINRSTTFDDGNGNTIVQKTNLPQSFTTGTFTADATTQFVKMTVSAGSQFLSGYQLRAIPEPTALALGAMGIVGLLTTKRRR